MDRQEIIKAEKELLYDEDKYLKDFLEETNPCPIISHEEMQRILSEPIKEDTKERRAINMIKKGRVKERECDVIANIFQRAIKRNGLTKEQVKSINKEMLEEVREERK